MGLCHDLRSLIRRFWLGCSKGKKGICWKAWNQLYQPKAEGGLGFRDFEVFNLAMLAKQFWRLYLYPNSLLARTLNVIFGMQKWVITLVMNGVVFGARVSY